MSAPFGAGPLRIITGAAIALAIAALVAMVLWAIFTTASDSAAQPPRVDIWRLVVMTTVQAGLTTILSLLVGTALAWALNRLRFPGRDLIVGLFAWTAGLSAAWLTYEVGLNLPADDAISGIGTMDQATAIFDRNDKHVFTIFKEQRLEVGLDDVSPNVIKAVLSAERSAISVKVRIGGVREL